MILRDWVDSYIEFARFGTPEKIKKAIDALFKHANDEDISPETRAHVRDAYYWLLLQFVPRVRNDLKGNGKCAADWLLLNDGHSYRRPLAAAEVLHRIGRKKEAFEVLRQYKDRRDWYANRLWVNLLSADGEYDEAVKVAEHGTELMPEHREVWNSLYHSCLQVSNMQEANLALAKAKDTWSREQAIIADLRSLYARH